MRFVLPSNYNWSIIFVRNYFTLSGSSALALASYRIPSIQSHLCFRNRISKHQQTRCTFLQLQYATQLNTNATSSTTCSTLNLLQRSSSLRLLRPYVVRCPMHVRIVTDRKARHGTIPKEASTDHAYLRCRNTLII